MTASVCFVAGPSSAPNITLDMTDETTVLARDFTLGNATFDAAPNSVGGVDGYRTASFRIQVAQGYSQTASALQAVARQLLAARNWLMVLFDPSAEPVFLRTYKTQQAALEWDNAGAGIWELPVTLVCDPFLRGVPETIGPVTVGNNPTTGTYPAFYRLPAVKGDAEAPLDVTLATAGASLGTVMVATASTVDAGQSAPLVSPTTPTLITDATLFSDATGSGGSTTRISFATATYVTRFSFPLTLKMGEYRVLARVRTSSASVFTMGLSVVLAESTHSDVPVGTWGYVDLGVVPFPFGNMPELGEFASTDYTTTVIFNASRVSGSGNLDPDHLLFVPVSLIDSTANTYARIDLGLAAYTNVRVDSAARAVRPLSSTLTPVRAVPATGMAGGWPAVVPGGGNVLHLLQTYSGVSDVLASTMAVTLSYVPLYAHMRPDGT